VFGGTTDRAARLVLRPAAEVTVRVKVLRAGRTVAALAPGRLPAGRARSLVLPGATLGPGAYTVRVTTTRGPAAARRTSTRTLALRGL
jgi:hypothetical protein